jgi:serine/threonine protein kinase
VSAASRYRIGRLIKRGGMAEVYEGFLVGEGDFQRRVAIKRLLAGYDPEEEAALADEARIAGQLHHAGIVGVLDFGTLDGVPFIVTELVDGVDVAGLSGLADQHETSIPAEIALRIGVEVGHALAHAHNAGIVHRDVSPENVLLSWSGDVKLTDFGIARAPGRRAETKVGETKGKLGFMSPEQLRGEDVDARTDVFALGCLLHFAIAQTSPLEISPQLAAGELSVTIDAALPEDLRAIVERATAIDPRRRFPSASELAEACAAALFARVRSDPRAITAAWLAPLKPREVSPVARKARAGDLLELVFDEVPPSGLRRFTSIVARSETELVADQELTVRAAAPVVAVTIPAQPSVVDTTTRVPILERPAAKKMSWRPFLLAGLLAIPAGVMLALASARREEERPVIVQPVQPVQAVQPVVQTPTVAEPAGVEPEAVDPAPIVSEKPQKRVKIDPRDESELRASLARRGLELADLGALPDTKDKYIEWKALK